MKTSAPLTKTQYGIYVECVQHLGEYRYNITYLYTLDGSLKVTGSVSCLERKEDL